MYPGTGYRFGSVRRIDSSMCSGLVSAPKKRRFSHSVPIATFPVPHGIPITVLFNRLYQWTNSQNRWTCSSCCIRCETNSSGEGAWYSRITFAWYIGSFWRINRGFMRAGAVRRLECPSCPMGNHNEEHSRNHVDSRPTPLMLSCWPRVA
jgi:hypothetical protein